MRTTMAIFVLMLMLAGPLAADRIYIWTDENGVKRFSDALPDDVQAYETAESATIRNPTSGTDEKGRPGLNKMLEDVEEENRQTDARKEAEESRRVDAQAAKAKAEKDAKAAGERARIQKQIDALNNRALSPTFTQGMRDNQIEALQKQMDAIE